MNELVPEFDENTVFLCKTDALAFLERLHHARQQVLKMGDSDSSRESLSRIEQIELQVEAMMADLE